MYRIRAGQPQTHFPVLKKLSNKSHEVATCKTIRYNVGSGFCHFSCGKSWKNLMAEIEQVSYMLREPSLEV